MKYQTVVFDLDGTLTDSAPGVVRSVRHALESMDCPVPGEDILRGFIGPPLVGSFMKQCDMTEAQAIQATLHYRQRYHRVGWRENRVFPGFRALLKALKEAGCYVGVATIKPQDVSEKVLKHFGLDQYLDIIVGPTPDMHHANKGDLLKKALAHREEPAVMIGDRATDIIAAHQLGVHSVAVLFGYGSQEELLKADPTHVAQDVDALYDILGIAPLQPKGYFVSLEGNDGCGKSTQVDMLHQFLADAGYPAVKTREPGGTELGEKIRRLVLDREDGTMRPMTEALLYAAARAQHVREVIQPALQTGSVLLCDRYVDSSVAYQGAGRELGMELVAGINAPAIDNTLPDLTILLEIDEQAALARRKQATEADRLELLDAAFHARVAGGFRTLAQQNPARIITVDANGTPEEVAQRVRHLVLKGMRKAGIP